MAPPSPLSLYKIILEFSSIMVDNIQHMLTRFILLFSLICFSVTGAATPEQMRPVVLVSLAPYAYFVDKIAGDTIDVEVIVPPGASPHTYEPTPRQTIKASKAVIWFRAGEGFELQTLPALKGHNPKLVDIDLREGLDLIYVGGHTTCQHADCYDPHVWLSPRLAQEQVTKITEVLSQQYPENRALYYSNLRLFKEELVGLDQQLTEILKPIKGKTVVVSHPAYGYLFRDYQIRQLPIEFEGRDPTPKQVTTILKQTRDLEVPAIFIQAQHSSKGAKMIAMQLRVHTIPLDPLAGDYQNNLVEMAKNFALYGSKK